MDLAEAGSMSLEKMDLENNDSISKINHIPNSRKTKKNVLFDTIRPLSDAAVNSVINAGTPASMMALASVPGLKSLDTLPSISLTTPCETILIRNLPFTRQRSLLRELIIRFIVLNLENANIPNISSVSNNKIENLNDTQNISKINKYYTYNDIKKSILSVKICKPTSRTKRIMSKIKTKKERKIELDKFNDDFIDPGQKYTLLPALDMVSSMKHSKRSLQAFVSFTDISIAKATVAICNGLKLMTTLAPEDVILGYKQSDNDLERSMRFVKGEDKPIININTSITDNTEDNSENKDLQKPLIPPLAKVTEEMKKDPRRFVKSSLDYYRDFRGNEPLKIEYARVPSQSLIKYKVKKEFNRIGLENSYDDSTLVSKDKIIKLASSDCIKYYESVNNIRTQIDKLENKLQVKNELSNNKGRGRSNSKSSIEKPSLNVEEANDLNKELVDLKNKKHKMNKMIIGVKEACRRILKMDSIPELEQFRIDTNFEAIDLNDKEIKNILRRHVNKYKNQTIKRNIRRLNSLTLKTAKKERKLVNKQRSYYEKMLDRTLNSIATTAEYAQNSLPA